MTSYTPPAFNLLNPAEAADAARWVKRASAAVPTILRGGHPINSYSTMIGAVLDAGYGGDRRSMALGLADGAVAAGLPAYAECIHDLHLITWSDMGCEAYAQMIGDLFSRAQSSAANQTESPDVKIPRDD